MELCTGSGPLNWFWPSELVLVLCTGSGAGSGTGSGTLYWCTGSAWRVTARWLVVARRPAVEEQVLGEVAGDRADGNGEPQDPKVRTPP